MNVTVDVNATFNPLGEIKPLYVRLEDENHELQVAKIENIWQVKDERYLGIHAVIFICEVMLGGALKRISLRYYIESHKWAIMQ